MEEENVNQALTEQEMDDAEDNVADPVVTYMEAPTTEFENVVE